MPDDATMIAARKAVSLARKELNAALLTLPYDRLGDLAELREKYDRAHEYVVTLQHSARRD